MADPICRWRNVTIKQVCEFTAILPYFIMKKDAAREYVNNHWKMWDGSQNFFRTAYQLASQLGLYYEDSENFYPRFDHALNFDEAKSYIEGWVRRYYIPNPYTDSIQDNNGIFVLNSLLMDIIQAGKKATLKDALESTFDIKLGNADIIANMLNLFSDISVEADGTIALKGNYQKKTLPPVPTDKLDKKVFFDYFNDIVVPQCNIGENHSESIKDSADCLQVIYYGAPGTGKSNKIEEYTNGTNRIRTTFHPDSDYSTFVGAYKPTMEGYEEKLYTKDELISKLTEFKEHGVPYSSQKFGAKYWYSLKQLSIADKKAILSACGMSDSYTVEFDKGMAVGEEYLAKSNESHIVYKYVPQAFLKAYVNAWRLVNEGEASPYYLIIEEINRGNCAQIFGDLFQLLDRGDNGESKFAICPDDDIKRFLTGEFKDSVNLSEKIKNGVEMRLPSNLYIWATMNTSDQSLFPIDSAFKRRWDWEYMPIEKGNKDFIIEIGSSKYDWWQFISVINNKIDEITGSEDKKIGYWFAKPAGNGTSISCDQFVSKVLFYLWNDVYKDYADDNRSIFRIKEGNGTKKVVFTEFFGLQREAILHAFMEANGIVPLTTEDTDSIADETEMDEIAGIPTSQRDYSKYSINGDGEYGKGELVKRTIELFCRDHSDMNADSVRNRWMSLNCTIRHLVETQSDFEARISGSSDPNQRAKQVILSNGESIYVSTQIGSGNIQDFINKVNAANLDITIEKIR